METQHSSVDSSQNSANGDVAKIAGAVTASTYMKSFIQLFQKKKKEKHSVLQSDSLYYNMSHEKRGYALIFNHTVFNHPKRELEYRYGTDIDCRFLQRTLYRIGFKVVTHDDLKLEELKKEIKKISRKKFRKYSCLLIAVLSHGDYGVLCSKNADYSPTFLFDHFIEKNCPNLIGKPKIFIIQACQGKKVDCGVQVHVDSCDSIQCPLLWTEPDFLIAYSTLPGYYSWRNTKQGSWFIQMFCEELNKHWEKYDLGTILTFVHRRVAVDFESYSVKYPELCDKKQAPCLTSTLTKLLNLSNLTNKPDRHDRLRV